jgi:hypothetical protein
MSVKWTHGDSFVRLFELANQLAVFDDIRLRVRFDVAREVQGTRWHSWLRHCTKSRVFAGSIPDGVTGIFQWLNPTRTNTQTEICNTCCYSTATMISRTLLNVTLYAHCLCCFFSLLSHKTTRYFFGLLSHKITRYFFGLLSHKSTSYFYFLHDFLQCRLCICHACSVLYEMRIPLNKVWLSKDVDLMLFRKRKKSFTSCESGTLKWKVKFLTPFWFPSAHHRCVMLHNLWTCQVRTVHRESM